MSHRADTYVCIHGSGHLRLRYAWTRRRLTTPPVHDTDAFRIPRPLPPVGRVPDTVTRTTMPPRRGNIKGRLKSLEREMKEAIAQTNENHKGVAVSGPHQSPEEAR